MSLLIHKLQQWQNQRLTWFLLAILAVGLVVISHLFFQNYLFMQPCVQCVYIRFALLVIALGGIIIAIQPKKIIPKLIGFIITFGGVGFGLKTSWLLNKIHQALRNPDPSTLLSMEGCPTEPHFPFNLPLTQWLPGWFTPTGNCGNDTPIVPNETILSPLQQWFINLYQQADGWYLLPNFKFLNMPQACLLIFGGILILLVIFLTVWFFGLINNPDSSRSNHLADK